MLRSDQAPWRGGRNLHLSANVLMGHHLHLSANQRREHELRYTKSLPTVSACCGSLGQIPASPSITSANHAHRHPARGTSGAGDVTFLQAHVEGRWFYLYLFLDLYSRKIVGFEVHDTDSADHAAHLARRTALAETVHAMPVRPVLHGDNGATLKATTVLATLHWFGIEPSCAMGSTVWLQRKCGHRSATQFRSFQRPLRRPEAVAIAPVPPWVLVGNLLGFSFPESYPHDQSTFMICRNFSFGWTARPSSAISSFCRTVSESQRQAPGRGGRPRCNRLSRTPDQEALVATPR